MASLFECEIRYTIEDLATFHEHLDRSGANLSYRYEFSDHYFIPSHEHWNPVEKNLRVREWHFPAHPTRILFVKNEVQSIDGFQFKRAVYAQGKVPLLSEDVTTCRNLLEDLGFQPWFSLKKERASFWELPAHHFNTVTEYLDGVGWTGELEFEGDDPHQAKVRMEDALQMLNVPLKAVTFKSVAMLYAEHHNLW